ncbi:hypothetical protein [Gorillibacterium sp. CAU 1737]|uniref:hypothetical protein n=1 Tax=Gorillibacterium sp. CAU 1737 TaxID=3140362 RepID=UPI003260C1D5
MNRYQASFMKKADYFFGQKELVFIVYLHDAEDRERLDHVVFLEKVDGEVTGLYIRGMNPLLSGHRIEELDDFNLFDRYDGLEECKEEIQLNIESISLFFSSQYNELRGIFLSNSHESTSLFLAFLQDEMIVEKNLGLPQTVGWLEKRFSKEGVVAYEKRTGGAWERACYT